MVVSGMDMGVDWWAGREGCGKDREVRMITPGSGQDRAEFSQVSSSSLGRCFAGSQTLSLEPRRKI